MIILNGTSHPYLAESIATQLKVPCIQADVKRFEDQELCIKVTGELYEEDVIILQSTCKPANDHLIELLLLIDTVKRAGARRIICAIPYFGYSRQDRPNYKHSPLSASLVASLIEAAGAHQILTLDLHSKQMEGFFKVGVQNMSTLGLYKNLFSDAKENNYVIVSPDIGGLLRAQSLSNALDIDLAVINKSRPQPGQCAMHHIIGEIKDKNCIIIDDIIDSGGTLTKATHLLKENGAKSITACVTHAVLSGDCLQKINNSPLERLYITNSIYHAELPPKVKVLPIDDLFSNALRFFHKDRNE